MEEINNPSCPDFTAHSENAADRWRDEHGREARTSEEHDEVDRVAEAEYRECEGH